MNLKKIRHAVACAVEALESRRLLSTTPAIIKDINQTSDFLAPSASTLVGNFAYFAGQSSASDGQELWKTDGTAASTVLVKDINPGLSSSSPTQLTNVNGTLYFLAND